MRQIKFRAWDGEKMSEDWHLHDIWCAASGRGAPHPTLPFYNNPQTTIMQFTGLKDKNGKEIYEHDIIKMQSGKIKVVSYFDYIGSYGVGDSPNSEYYSHLDSLTQEIIGNIYENPELLETTHPQSGG